MYTGAWTQKKKENIFNIMKFWEINLITRIKIK